MTVLAQTDAHDAASAHGDDRTESPARLPLQRGEATTGRRSKPLTIGIVGLGYVGLPTALALLEVGCPVIGLDISAQRRHAIAELDVDVLPRDLERLTRYVDTPSFVMTGDPSELVGADVVVVCVPTPVDEYLTPDLAALRGACETLVANVRRGQVLMLTSTTYVGTTRDLLVRPLQERGFEVGTDVFVAFSPERIDPGNSTFTVERTPRVVGGVTAECRRRASEFVELIAPLVHEVSSCEAAEMAKLHENTFRAVNIAYVNEVSNVCELLGLDITEVIDAAATKPYGFMPFRPGPGVGGHCIPCDPHYLLWQLRAHRVQAPVIDSAMRAIAGRPGEIVNWVERSLARHGLAVHGSRVLVLGVSYKPGVADLRESPALEILSSLQRAGATVGFHDPLIDSLQLASGRMTGVTQLNPAEWDLVLVHTLHPGQSLDALRGQVPILDATFSIPSD